MISWDEYFFRLCDVNSAKSKDPSTKVGAVIVRPDKTIAGMGWNGFPRGVTDHYEDREDKLLRTVHAELNAILNAREPLHGYTLYVAPLFPCANCAAAIIQSGVTCVIARMGQPREEWAKSFHAARDMFRQAFVDFEIYPEK
jgi:dCMP deaminase